MSEKCAIIELPLPISVNWAYSTVKTPNGKTIRVKSSDYRDWEKIANIAYNKYSYEITWDSWLWVDYQFYMPIYTKEWKKRKIDTFNLEKVLSDFLSKRIPWFEDHKILDWRVRKINSNNNIVKIKIYETSEM